MEQVYEQRLAARLAVIEELRIELGTEGIRCPGVVVVGAQSSGKSSVLERLTEIAFPRAENTCTRVPTIVQLQTDPSVSIPKATVSTDSSLQENAIECGSMQEIREAILELTGEIVDETTPIRDDPIHIRYVRSKGPVMTLIDLPGITHVDINRMGFNPHDVTAAMVKNYVDNENMIMLVVIPANDDFGNSEALSIAQNVDEDGNRTVGVVSKCDLVPPERSDVVHKIRMTREIDAKLALGFVAVRNKGPGEEGIDINTVERQLFETHPILKQLREDERGYEALSQKIVDLQSDRVGRFIPEAKTLVKRKIEEIKADLERIGYTPYTHSQRNILLNEELVDINRIICNLIRAESCEVASINIAARTDELSKNFAATVRNKVPDCLSSEYGIKLRDRMAERMGFSLPNFMNDSVFRKAVDEVLFADNLPSNTELFIEDVAKLMNNVFQNIIPARQAMTQFPQLTAALLDESGQSIRRAKQRAKEVTGMMLAAEKVQVYTQNSHYMGIIGQTKQKATEKCKKEIRNGMSIKHFGLSTSNGMSTSNSLFGKSTNDSASGYQLGISTSNSADCQTPTGNDENGISHDFISKYSETMTTAINTTEQGLLDLQISIHCYVDTVMRRLFDVIPMLVRSVMVYDLQEKFHTTMLKVFDDEDVLEGAFSEDPAIERERKKLQLRMQRMRRAQERLNALN